jgi:hypothetical protein
MRTYGRNRGQGGRACNFTRFSSPRRSKGGSHSAWLTIQREDQVDGHALQKVGAGQAEERAAVEIVVWNYELEVRGGGTRDGTLYLGRLVLQ